MKKNICWPFQSCPLYAYVSTTQRCAVPFLCVCNYMLSNSCHNTHLPILIKMIFLRLSFLSFYVSYYYVSFSSPCNYFLFLYSLFLSSTFTSSLSIFYPIVSFLYFCIFYLSLLNLILCLYFSNLNRRMSNISYYTFLENVRMRELRCFRLEQMANCVDNRTMVIS